MNDTHHLLELLIAIEREAYTRVIWYLPSIMSSLNDLSNKPFVFRFLFIFSNIYHTVISSTYYFLIILGLRMKNHNCSLHNYWWSDNAIVITVFIIIIRRHSRPTKMIMTRTIIITSSFSFHCYHHSNHYHSSWWYFS